MAGGKAAKWIFMGAGAFLVVGTTLFGQYDWWFDWTKGIRPIKFGNFLGTLLFCVGWMGWAHIQAIRSGTGKILFQDGTMFDYNPNDRHEIVGQFLALRRGGISSLRWFLNTSGKEGTILVPPDACRKVGRHIFVAGIPDPIYFSELPPSHQDKLDKKGLIAPYSLVSHPKHVETRGHVYVERMHQLLKELAAKTQDEVVLRRTMRMGDQAVRYANSIVDEVLRRREEPWWQRLFPGRKKKEDSREAEAAAAPPR